MGDGRSKYTCGFEAYLESGVVLVFSDSAYHYHGNSERGVDGLFAGGSLDEVATSHHAYHRGSEKENKPVKIREIYQLLLYQTDDFFMFSFTYL